MSRIHLFIWPVSCELLILKLIPGVTLLVFYVNTIVTKYTSHLQLVLKAGRPNYKVAVTRKLNPDINRKFYSILILFKNFLPFSSTSSIWRHCWSQSPDSPRILNLGQLHCGWPQTISQTSSASHSYVSGHRWQTSSWSHGRDKITSYKINVNIENWT